MVSLGLGVFAIVMSEFLPVTDQPSYSIPQSGAEAHVLPVTERYGMGVLAWSRLASGWLSGAVREGRDVSTNRSGFMPQRFDLRVPANRARMDAVEQLVARADQAGLALIQLALGLTGRSTCGHAWSG